MANNIDVNKTIAEIDKLNDSLNETANRIKSIVDLQQSASKELNSIKGLTATNEKLNTTKNAQNQIEIEGEKLLRQRNSLVAKQDELLKGLTKDTIKQQEANKKYVSELKAEGDAYKKLDLAHKNALANAKKIAAQYGINSKQAKDAAASANKMGNELKKIDSSLGQNQRSVGGYGKALLKFAGQLGIVTGGVALLKGAFEGITKGSQSAGDAWARTMGSMTAATHVFFSAIGTGNFVDFTGRLKEAIKAGREYADALDDLFEGGLSLEVAEAKSAKIIAEQQLIRDNVNKTKDERLDAARLINEEEDKILDKRLTEAGKEYEAHAKYIEGIQGLDRKKLISFIENYRQEEDIRNRAIAKRNREAELYANAYVQYVGADGRIETTIDKVALKEYEAFKNTYTNKEKIYLAFYDKYQGSADEMVSNTVKSYAKMTKLEAESLKSRRRNENKFNALSKELNETKAKETIKAQKEVYLAYRKTMEQNAKGIKVPIFAEWKRDLDANKAKAKKDWEDTVAYIFNTKNGTTISRPTDITIKAKAISQEILDAANATVDDSPVTFWDKLLELPADKLQQTVGQIQDLGNVLFDLGSAQRERELSEVQENYAARMQAAEGNADLQAKLQKELEQEQKRINRESAIAEKNNAIFNVAMNTAVAVSKVWGQTGIFGIAAEIPVIAMGALQTAAILSRPLPGFFKGTENAPAGLAWVAEHGAELITTKSGEQYLAKEKQVVNFSGGERVDTAADTQRLLNSAIYNDIVINGNNGMETRMDRMISKLENLNQLNVNFDEKGMTIYAQQGKSITKYLNSKGRK